MRNHHYDNNWEYLVRSDGTAAITGIKGDCSGHIVIPSEVGGRTVTAIEFAAFCGRSFITKVVIPESVNFLGESCFEGCDSLVSVHLPASVSTLPTSCFEGDEELRSVNLDHVLFIRHCAFADCSSLKIAEGPALAIGVAAFKGCTSLERIGFPSLKSMGSHAFSECRSLRLFHFPMGVKEIPFGAFRGCTALKKVDLFDGTLSIGAWAFFDCTSLETVHAKGVLSVGKHAFHGCENLSIVHLPSIVKLGDRAFDGCTALEAVSLGGSSSSAAICSGDSQGELTETMEPEQDALEMEGRTEKTSAQEPRHTTEEPLAAKDEVQASGEGMTAEAVAETIRAAIAKSGIYFLYDSDVVIFDGDEPVQEAQLFIAPGPDGEDTLFCGDIRDESRIGYDVCFPLCRLRDIKDITYSTKKDDGTTDLNIIIKLSDYIIYFHFSDFRGDFLPHSSVSVWSWPASRHFYGADAVYLLQDLAANDPTVAPKAVFAVEKTYGKLMSPLSSKPNIRTMQAFEQALEGWAKAGSKRAATYYLALASLGAGDVVKEIFDLDHARKLAVSAEIGGRFEEHVMMLQPHMIDEDEAKRAVTDFELYCMDIA